MNTETIPISQPQQRAWAGATQRRPARRVPNLWQAARDVDTLVQLFVQHRAQLLSVAQKVVRRTDQADDVVQEAYLKIAQGSCAERVEKPLQYLTQVVRNLAVDFRRRSAAELRFRGYAEDGELTQIEGGLRPEQGFDERRALGRVGVVLQGLPARTRLAFELHRISGLTQREIGRQLGCSATLVNFMVRDAGEAIAEWRQLGTRTAH
ncbi:MAG: sigma-70 family RNA polymerase sigma factor [Polyangiaceae bacterium]